MNHNTIQAQIWSASIPLEIIHPSSAVPYIIHVPRLSYLPLLLPRLTSFFGPATTFSHESIVLRNLPIGLLYDLYQPDLPWRLTLGEGFLFDIQDTFINSVKEVCRVFLCEVNLAELKTRQIFCVMARRKASCRYQKSTPLSYGMRCKIVDIIFRAKAGIRLIGDAR